MKKKSLKKKFAESFGYQMCSNLDYQQYEGARISQKHRQNVRQQEI